MLETATLNTFVVEIDDAPDALIRVLGAFAVQQARFAGVRHDAVLGRARTVVEVTGLDAARARLLAARLAQMACVRDVRVCDAVGGVNPKSLKI
jgi:hypothetical protein